MQEKSYSIPKDVLRTMDPRYALFGTLFAFQNRLQAAGDAFYEEITSKQFFLLTCLSLFPEQPPTASELAQVMGSSHQNVKQLLLKLEQKDLVQIVADENDRRKLRVHITEKMKGMAEHYHQAETQFIEQLFDGITCENAAQAFETLTHLEENLAHIKIK